MRRMGATQVSSGSVPPGATLHSNMDMTRPLTPACLTAEHAAPSLVFAVPSYCSGGHSAPQSLMSPSVWTWPLPHCPRGR